MVVVVLWCALWSSLALIGVQKHRGVLVCRRGHRKHDNDPQSGGTGEGKYRQNKRQRKFLTSAGFPSVWCLSGVPEGLLIAGDHQTSIQTRGKSNSPPSRSRPRQRGRRCPLLVLYCSRGPGFLSCHGTTELQQTPRPPFCIEVQVSGSKATSLSLLHAEAGLRKLRHLTKWAGAAVRMGQQGGQTEALWTHLDPSKPPQKAACPCGCPCPIGGDLS